MPLLGVGAGKDRRWWSVIFLISSHVLPCFFWTCTNCKVSSSAKSVCKSNMLSEDYLRLWTSKFMVLVIFFTFKFIIVLLGTPSVPNCRSFDFFNSKFDYSSYLKICAKHHFFLLWLALLIQVLEEWFKFDYICINFLIRRVVKLVSKKSNDL